MPADFPAVFPAMFPAMFGSYALLKRLADEGERSVYLVAINGAGKPWVMKTLPLPGEGAAISKALSPR